jgi:tRNA G10  N-methylase Trm11
MFIVRRNPTLSANEITSYLHARAIQHEVTGCGSEYVTCEIRDFDAPRAMGEIGETLKIGEVMARVRIDGRGASGLKNPEAFANLLEKSILIPEDLRSRAHDVRLIGVSVYPRSVNELRDVDFDQIAQHIGDLISTKMVAEVGLSRSLAVITAKSFKHENRADITPIDCRKKDLHDRNLELLVGLEGGECCIGVTLAVCDQEALNRRGIERSSRPSDWKYGMAPNYAKALVNLAEAKKGDLLLDPFCGIGTILQEAALNRVRFVGVDIDNGSVQSTRENLSQLSKECRLNLQNLDRAVVQGDATKLTELFACDSFDAVATEPYLGPALTKRPKHESAKEILGSLRHLYQKALSEIWSVLKVNKKAVIVSPIVSSSHGSVTLNLKDLAARCGFRTVNSITDRRIHQLVSREIVVLEKM